MGAMGGQAGGGAPGSGGHSGVAGAGTGGTGGGVMSSGGAPAGSGGAGAVVGAGGDRAGNGGAPAGTGGAASSGGVTGSGGAPVGSGGASVGGRGGGSAGAGGLGSGGGAAGSPDSSRYGFESSLQGWAMATGGGAWTSIARSTAVSFAGVASLAGSVSAQSGTMYILEVAPPTPAIPAGAIVTFHVRVPATAMLTSIQAYVMETGTFRFTGTQVAGADLARNAWVKIDVHVPADAASILRAGVQFESSGAWSDTVYLDAIDW